MKHGTAFPAPVRTDTLFVQITLSAAEQHVCFFLLKKQTSGFVLSDVLTWNTFRRFGFRHMLISLVERNKVDKSNVDIPKDEKILQLKIQI